ARLQAATASKGVAGSHEANAHLHLDASPQSRLVPLDPSEGQHGVEELARLLGVAIGQQLHRALQVGEEDGDLLALALERARRRQDLLGEVARRVRAGRPEVDGWGRGDRCPARGAKLLSRREPLAAVRAGKLKASPAVLAEPGDRKSVV